MADLNRGAGVTDAPVKPSEILDKAADQIKRHGWVQRDWWEADAPTAWTECKVCATGGVNAAAGLRPEFEQHEGFADGAPVVVAFMTLAEQIAGHPAANVDEAVSRVISWNDSLGRTAEEVVRGLRAAAAKAREAGR